ncbi:MAG: N-acetylmuramoyl-L-alanine amidase [Methyloligellaceae bacterium]
MTFQPDSDCVAQVLPSPNYEPRRNEARPDMLLLHYTGMESAAGALKWLTTKVSKVSCHYLVDETGQVTQMVPEAMRAWHAGVSCWAGEEDVNSCSIGIEVHNPGHEFGYPDFPEAQMRAVEALSADIVTRNRIARARVLAHSDVAPARKMDPGEKFDWRRLAEAGAGLWVEPEPLGDDAGLAPGQEGEAVLALQEALAAFGYAVAPSGVYDTATRDVVTAFQRHYRPQRVDGNADRSTRRTLERLLAALKTA